MRHISGSRLDELEPLLRELRALTGLREPKRGVFHRKSRSFLHFHEDPAGLFADVRLVGPDFERVEVTTRSAQAALMKRIRAALE